MQGVIDLLAGMLQLTSSTLLTAAATMLARMALDRKALVHMCALGVPKQCVTLLGSCMASPDLAAALVLLLCNLAMSPDARRETLEAGGASRVRVAVLLSVSALLTMRMTTIH